MISPNTSTAETIIHKHFSQDIVSIERFPTGLCHFVYDVKLSDGLEVVLRISGSDDQLSGGIFWNKKLKELDIPVPEILHYDIESDLKYSIHRKIKGNDLWFEYPKLSSIEKKELAYTLAEYQLRVENNIKGTAFGYASSYDDPTLKDNWNDIIVKSIADSERNIRQVGIFDIGYVEKLKIEHKKFETYLKNIKPLGFLDDITTKNVIIHNNKLSGIVDTDSICFGDKLKHLGLTNMALVSLNYDTDYIDYFIEYYKLSDHQRAVVEFYTLLFCVGFMSEMGQKYNKDSVEIDQERVEYLKQCFNQILEMLHYFPD